MILYCEGLVYYLSRFLYGLESSGAAKSHGVDPRGGFAGAGGRAGGKGVVGGGWLMATIGVGVVWPSRLVLYEVCRKHTRRQ